MSKEFYSRIANLLVAHNNCVSSGNKEYMDIHYDKLEELVAEYLPRGSGFDHKTKFVWEESNQNKLVFTTAFHHMDESGYYSGWTEHKIIVTPDLLFGCNIKITGKNRNDIKEYIHTRFSDFDYAE
jgi:hypothetical protein